MQYLGILRLNNITRIAVFMSFERIIYDLLSTEDN